jgi:putative oxidoreductase
MTSLALEKHDSLTAGALRRFTSALLSTGNSPALTVLRITLGLVMLPHGLQKTAGWFGGHGFSATMDAFVGMGIPALLAFLAIAAESAGAIALIPGFTTRIAAFGVGVTMAVAGLMHRANGFFMNWSGAQSGEGYEFHLLAIGIAVALVVGGAGRWSLDRFVTRKGRA